LVAERPFALLLVGGTFHDFDGFADMARETLAAVGLDVRVERDFDLLTRLDALGARLVVMYTCFDEVSGVTHRAEQIAGLRNWVAGGGALLALHATSVSAARSQGLEALIGAAFAEHPPKALFRVAPVGAAHPSTLGVVAFEIEDELYRHRAAPKGDVHLIAEDEGVARPVAWSRREGAGRVYYLALGHDASAWGTPAYRRVLAQAARWLTTA